MVEARRALRSTAVRNSEVDLRNDASKKSRDKPAERTAGFFPLPGSPAPTRLLQKSNHALAVFPMLLGSRVAPAFPIRVESNHAGGPPGRRASGHMPRRLPLLREQSVPPSSASQDET